MQVLLCWSNKDVYTCMLASTSTLHMIWAKCPSNCVIFIPAIFLKWSFACFYTHSILLVCTWTSSVFSLFTCFLKCAFVQYREMAIADIIYKAAGRQTSLYIDDPFSTCLSIHGRSVASVRSDTGCRRSKFDSLSTSPKINI